MTVRWTMNSETADELCRDKVLWWFVYSVFEVMFCPGYLIEESFGMMTLWTR